MSAFIFTIPIAALLKIRNIQWLFPSIITRFVTFPLHLQLRDYLPPVWRLSLLSAHSRVALGIDTALKVKVCACHWPARLAKLHFSFRFCVQDFQANDVGANQRRVSPTLPLSERAKLLACPSPLNWTRVSDGRKGKRNRKTEKKWERKSGAACQSLMKNKKNRREHQRKWKHDRSHVLSLRRRLIRKSERCTQERKKAQTISDQINLKKHPTQQGPLSMPPKTLGSCTATELAREVKTLTELNAYKGPENAWEAQTGQGDGEMWVEWVHGRQPSLVPKTRMSCSSCLDTGTDKHGQREKRPSVLQWSEDSWKCQELERNGDTVLAVLFLSRAAKSKINPVRHETACPRLRECSVSGRASNLLVCQMSISCQTQKNKGIELQHVLEQIWRDSWWEPSTMFIALGQPHWMANRMFLPPVIVLAFICSLVRLAQLPSLSPIALLCAVQNINADLMHTASLCGTASRQIGR